MQLTLSDEMNECDDHLINDKEAARIIGATRATIRQSRHTGTLFGKAAPPFIK